MKRYKDFIKNWILVWWNYFDARLVLDGKLREKGYEIGPDDTVVCVNTATGCTKGGAAYYTQKLQQLKCERIEDHRLLRKVYLTRTFS